MKITDKQRLDFLEKECYLEILCGKFNFFYFSSENGCLTLREEIDAAIRAMEDKDGVI